MWINVVLSDVLSELDSNRWVHLFGNAHTRWQECKKLLMKLSCKLHINMGTERKCTIYKHLLSRDLQSSHSYAKVYTFNRNKVVWGAHVIVSLLINK